METSATILLLQDLSSANGDVRRNAEANLNSLKSNVELYLHSLLSVLRNGAIDSYLRQMCCIILRRSIVESSDECLDALNIDRYCNFIDLMVN
jgi:hypothetical protein